MNVSLDPERLAAVTPKALEILRPVTADHDPWVITTAAVTHGDIQRALDRRYALPSLVLPPAWFDAFSTGPEGESGL